MKEIWLVLQEQFKYFPVMWRLASYEKKARYQNHALGNFWLFLNPFMQVATYWMVFGFGFGTKSPVEGVPYMPWLIIGLATWLFINTSFMDSTWSISSKIWEIARMRFPMSIMPMMRTLMNFNAFAYMLIIGIVMSVFYGLPITWYWLQVFYYIFAAFAFLYALGILNATVTVLLQDYQQIMQTVMRFIFWISGALFSVSDKFGAGHERIVRALETNPFYYLVSGVRDSFFGHTWFWENTYPMLVFWLFTFSVLIIGSHLHLKFRAYFADLV